MDNTKLTTISKDIQYILKYYFKGNITSWISPVNNIFVRKVLNTHTKRLKSVYRIELVGVLNYPHLNNFEHQPSLKAYIYVDHDSFNTLLSYPNFTHLRMIECLLRP